MKTISRADALTLDGILRRAGYDTGEPPGFGPRWCNALADFGEKAGMGDLAQVESYDSVAGRPAPPANTPTACILTDADRARVDARSEANLATLDPRVQPFFRALINRALAAGILMVLTSGSRTYDEQAELRRKYEAGGPKAARAGNSNHNFGLAGDVTEFADATHKTPVWDGPNYKRAGLIGEAVGLFWGGRWTGRDEDQPHFEFRPAWALGMAEGDMIAELRARKAAGRDLLA